jgi:N-acyl-D-amino-acid deacylase
MLNTFLLLPLLLVSPGPQATSYDLVLRGATIVDGSGKPGFEGDVAIRDSRIVAVGEAHGKGKREIQLRGQTIAPGFIDVHTHSENIMRTPGAQNFVRMGVTTIVTGNCGSSTLNVGSFLNSVDGKAAVNVGTLLGLGTLRASAMGGSFDRPPNAREMERMRSAVDQAMRQGALGISTGLIYLPGTFSKTDEIVELAKIAAKHGGIYASHMRNESAKIYEALDELIEVARQAKIRAQVSHIKLGGNGMWGQADRVLQKLDHARAEGLDIAHDQYLYTASSTGLSALIPDWVREGGDAAFRRRLADPSTKNKIIQDMKDRLAQTGRDSYAYAVIASYAREPRFRGKNIQEAAKLKYNQDDLDAQIWLILDIHRNGGGRGVFHGMHEGDVKRFLAHPLTMIASDAGPSAGGAAHPRGQGNAVRALSRYVRELNLLTLEEAVRRMTSLPAETFKIKHRGRIGPGYWADVVVFDPAKIEDRATFDNPGAAPVGISLVLVNGTPVFENGRPTAARPGKAIRRN